MPVPTSPSLSGVIDRVAWAEKHLERLKRLVSAYTRVPPYAPRIARQIGDQWGQPWIPVIATDVKPLPQTLPFLVGDFVHNLRVSLDYLARELVLVSGDVPKTETVFRLFGKFPTDLKFIDDDGNAKLISPKPRDDIYALVEGLQPYQRAEGYRSHPLHILHKLDIADKHHGVHIIQSTGRYWDTQVEFANGQTLSFAYSHMGKGSPDGRTTERLPLKEGTVIGAIEVARCPAPIVKVKCEVEVVVALGELGSMDDKVIPLTDHLQSLLNFIREDVIPLFKPFFKHPALPSNPIV